MRRLVVCLVVVTVSFGTAHAALPVEERDALMSLYNATNGPGWTYQTGWGGPTDPCTWIRVHCVEDPGNPGIHHVDTLLLNDNNLVGFIPAEIEDLVDLRLLYFKNSDFSGPVGIPPEIGNLAMLETFDCFNCRLEGEIPPQLSLATSLKRIFLEFNNLEGTIPPDLGGLSNLLWLQLYDNNLVGEIPEELSQISTLTRLKLYNNQLEGEIPTALGGLSNLEILNLHSNRLVGVIPDTFGSLASLTELNLHSNNLVGDIPVALGSLSNLEILNLGNNRLTGTIPPILATIPFLQEVYLNDNFLEGGIPPDFGSLEWLRKFDISHNNLGGYLPQELVQLTRLLRFYLQSNRFIGDFPVMLDTPFWFYHGVDTRYNAIYVTNPSMAADLQEKQVDSDYWSSQTTAPGGISVPLDPVNNGDHTVYVDWDEVIHLTSYEGGYEVFYRPAGVGGFFSAGWTSSKTVPPPPGAANPRFPVTGLSPDTLYDFTVATYTKPHADNKNEVLSEIGEIVTSRTNNMFACVIPVISLTWTVTGAELMVTQAPAQYSWSNGDTGQSTTVNPGGPEYFWVDVRDTGGCQESAVILVDPEFFTDGFESGDTSAWSSTVP